MRALESFEDESELNLTPLIDVIFVVLITFIVIAPLLEIDQVSLAPGRTDDAVRTASAASAITLHVHRNDAIWLNGTNTTLTELPHQLQALYAAHPSTTPQLFIDQAGRFGTYQEIKNAIEGAGFNELEVVLQPR